jgi:hypothetical protein
MRRGEGLEVICHALLLLLLLLLYGVYHSYGNWKPRGNGFI